MSNPETSGRTPPSLFSQIAIRLALVALVFSLLNVGIVVANYALDQQAMAEDFVGQQASRIARAWPGQGRQSPLIEAPQGVSEWSYQVLDAAGRTVAGGGVDAALPAALRPEPTALERTFRDEAGQDVRIRGLRRLNSGHWVVVSARIHSFTAYVPVIARELRDHVVLPLVPLTLLLLAFNVVVVRHMLTPLATAAAEVDALDPARMDARLTNPISSREVHSLVAAVNRALERLQHAMGLLKNFTADAAHELRTPLSVLQLRLHELPEGAAKQRLREDLKGMTRLVNQMLDLSQAEALSLEDARVVDLHALAEETLAQTAPLAFEQDRDLRLIDLGAGAVFGHSDALGRVLRNLIENALRHAGGNGSIDVIVGPGPRVAVRDHGRGLDMTDPDLIFRRFWKTRRTGSDGAGLGLGIARSIVEAYGGTLRAGNAEGGGAQFTCEFPNLPGRSRGPGEGRAPAADLRKPSARKTARSGLPAL